MARKYGVMTMATKSDGQIGLFNEPSYVPAWKKSSTFDPALATRFKNQGMSASANLHQELLAQVKVALVKIARGRDSRCVTADDAAAWLIGHGHSAASLGNAAGSLFKGDEWELVGYRPSERTSRHRNRVGVWRLREHSEE